MSLARLMYSPTRGNVTDFFQHLQAGFVRTAVRRAPQAGDTGSDTGERVGTRRTGQTDGGGRGILLVIGVQREDGVERVDQNRVRHVLLARVTEHHAHEVGGVVQIVVRIHERRAGVVLVGHGDDGRHLGDQAVEADVAVLGIGEVHRVMVEGRQGTNDTGHDGHRVSVTAEAGVELGQLLVHHRVLLDGVFEIALLTGVRQLAVLQQIGHFEEVAVLSQLLDRIAAIQQLALVTVDEGNLGLAAGGGEETGVVGKQTGLATEGTNIDAVVAVRRRHDREIDGSLSVDVQSCLAFGRHGVFPLQVLVVTALPKKR